MSKTIKRRRKAGKTDYKARLSFLKSGKQRLVIRITNRYVLAQLVETNAAQDKVLISASSKNLLDNGWEKDHIGSLKCLAAAYLTGYSLGKNATNKEAILDIGLNRNVYGSRIYAVLKGAIDAGLIIPHNKKVLPTDERISSSNKLKIDISKIKGNI